MFNSQKINDDPYPWIEWESDTRYTLAEVEAENKRDRCWRGLAERPRPEFDNNPNPIMAAFRDYCIEATPLEFRDAARTWQNLADGYSVSRSHPEASRIYEKLWMSDAVTLAHEEHASKVLTRLANLHNTQGE